MLKGIGVSQGYGIGKSVIISEPDFDFSAVEFTTIENEKARLHYAFDKFVKDTRALADNLKETAGDYESEIILGHITMLHDPYMISQMEEIICEGLVAENAVSTVCDRFIDMFSAVDDVLTRQRISDIEDIKKSLLCILLGVTSFSFDDIQKGSVLVARDFTPSMTSQIKKDSVSAIITEVGGVTSHSAILARAMGIPAVLSVENACSVIGNARMLIVDGGEGCVIIDPNDDEIGRYTKKQVEYLEEKESLNEYLSRKAVTKAGSEKRVYGNIGTPDEVDAVLQNGGEGIGLFRTEFLFMDRRQAPDEDEQYDAYFSVAKAMGNSEVIIRTLDIGGDKGIDYLSTEKEDNPFLGHRAIRYCLDNPDLFKTQIRAILRAATCGNVKIMLPLVASLDEVKMAKKLIRECEKELHAEGKAYKKTPLGVMIETPSAVLISDLLAREVDFFSIGTNDLTGYMMAVDRGNARVSHLYNTGNTSVMRAIKMTIENAKKAAIPVGMCGEAAADKALIPMFIEWGLDEFSVSPSSILHTKKIICES